MVRGQTVCRRDGEGAAMVTGIKIRQKDSTPPWRSFVVQLNDLLLAVTLQGGHLGLIGARSDLCIGRPNVTFLQDWTRNHY